MPAKKQPPRKVRVARVVNQVRQFKTSVTRERPTTQQRKKFK